MIVVTFEGGSPLLGRIRGWDVVRHAGRSVAAAIHSAMERFKNEGEGFLFVAPGGRVNSARVHLALRTPEWDIAAHVGRIGKIPKDPSGFDGIGRVSLDTVFFRRTPQSVRALARWRERNIFYPDREPINLAIALAEIPELRLLHLSQEWIWREEMRASNLNAEPVVEFGSSARKPPEPEMNISALTSAPVAPKSKLEPPKKFPPGVLWVGHLYQYTGYGKANREILFRLANSMSVRIDDAHKEPVYVKEDLRARLDVHKNVLVSPKAPLLRMMGPDHISQPSRHRIVWTMQETSERVHEDMVKRANANFDELWTPSKWNLDVFKQSGVRVPGRVMPLGVDPSVFRCDLSQPFPNCRLISTSRRGLIASPRGFIFLTVGLPGFRKGWDVIADAMELAFSKTHSVHFVIALTHSPAAWNEKVYKQFANYKFPIWTLEGSFEEHELARVYSSANAYVSASRGEGFNLPAAEAASCGSPVIVPENTCHPEIFGPEAFLFKPDGVKTYPEGDWISDWYKGQLFSRFGKPSIRRLAEILEHVHRGGSDVNSRRTALKKKIRSVYTWDAAAARAATLLLEVQP